MKSAPSPTADLYCSACERMFESNTGDSCPRDGTRLVKLAPQRDPFIGLDLDGRYLILDKLGQGGMGAVYRGTQKSVDREVAIKVVSPGRMSEPEIVKRFLREARLASRINHPNAASVVDFGQTADGVFYLVMELVAGRTLSAVLRAEKVLEPQRVVRIGAQICQALEGAHAIPIIHRDLKPANILIGANDFVKVVDFGIAKSLSAETLSSTMTNADAILGTPSFMPPEAARAMPCDERADLYSLGCVLYVAASGRLPFVSDDLPSMMMKHVVEPVPPLIGVPSALARVIYKLLEKEPADRYQTATATRLALEAALSAASSEAAVEPTTVKLSPMTGPESAGVTVPIDPTTLPTPMQTAVAASSPGRRTWLWIAAVAIVIAGIVVAVSALVSSSERPAVATPPPRESPADPASVPAPVAAQPTQQEPASASIVTPSAPSAMVVPSAKRPPASKPAKKPSTAPVHPPVTPGKAAAPSHPGEDPPPF